ncbi:MAG: MOSC domain-containing protein [Chthoniobacterales bacterium]
MSQIGIVDSLWRYPVKSMGGEELHEVFAGFAGFYGDRVFAFHSAKARKSLPYLTARDQGRMLLYRPRFRQPEKTIAPPNLAEAEKTGAGTTPLYGSAEDFSLDVETPDGEKLAIDDPELIRQLCSGLAGEPELTLIRSERALTDCRPVSIFALQTARALAEESGVPFNKRRFRANIYLDLTTMDGFAEDAFVGRSLRIGSKLTLAIVKRDQRCVIITLDPETAEKSSALFQSVAQLHEGNAGLYAVVLVEGMVRPGDAVELLP